MSVISEAAAQRFAVGEGTQRQLGAPNTLSPPPGPGAQLPLLRSRSAISAFGFLTPAALAPLTPRLPGSPCAGVGCSAAMAEGLGTDAHHNQRGLAWDLNDLLSRGMPPSTLTVLLKCRFQDPLRLGSMGKMCDLKTEALALPRS